MRETAGRASIARGIGMELLLTNSETVRRSWRTHARGRHSVCKTRSTFIGRVIAYRTLSSDINRGINIVDRTFRPSRTCRSCDFSIVPLPPLPRKGSLHSPSIAETTFRNSADAFGLTSLRQFMIVSSRRSARVRRFVSTDGKSGRGRPSRRADGKWDLD